MSANRNREEFGPITRNRSSSANEASKPIVMIHRRPTQLGNKPSNFSPTNGSNGGKFHFDLLQYLHTFSVFVFCFVFFFLFNFITLPISVGQLGIIQCVFFFYSKIVFLRCGNVPMLSGICRIDTFFLLFFETGRLIFYFCFKYNYTDFYIYIHQIHLHAQKIIFRLILGKIQCFKYEIMRNF